MLNKEIPQFIPEQDRIFSKFQKNSPESGILKSIYVFDGINDSNKEVHFSKPVIEEVYKKEVERITKIQSPLLVFGTDAQNLITNLITSRNTESPIFFLETNPQFLQNFLDLNKGLISKRSNIFLVGSDVPNVLFIKLSEFLSRNHYGKILSQFEIVITPSELEYLFRHDGLTGEIFRHLIKNVFTVNVPKKFLGMYKIKCVIYEKLYSILKLIIIASTGSKCPILS